MRCLMIGLLRSTTCISYVTTRTVMRCSDLRFLPQVSLFPCTMLQFWLAPITSSLCTTSDTWNITTGELVELKKKSKGRPLDLKLLKNSKTLLAQLLHSQMQFKKHTLRKNTRSCYYTLSSTTVYYKLSMLEKSIALKCWKSSSSCFFFFSG